MKAFSWKRLAFVLGITALSLALFSCGSSAPAEEVIDLSMSFGEALPAGIESAYLVIHHQDGSPKTWLDLKDLEGPQQDLRGVPKFGYFTVLTEVKGDDGSLQRYAATFPVAAFLGFDKGLSVGEDGRVAMVKQGAAKPWGTVTVRGSCPSNATALHNGSFGIRAGSTLECAAGTITQGEVSALTQTDGLLSTIIWTFSDESGSLQPTNPPQYAQIFDVVPGSTVTLATDDFETDALQWRLEVDGAPSGYGLLVRIAAFRSGAEVLGYNPFDLACSGATALCLQAYTADVNVDSHTIYGQLRKGNENLIAATTSWKPVSSPADVGQWDYSSDFDPAYGSIDWTGNPPKLTLSGGAEVRAQAAVALSRHTSTAPKQTRTWIFYPAETNLEIEFPELPDRFAGFIPDPAAEGVEAGVSGYGFDPLDELTNPATGRMITIYRRFKAVSGTALLVPDLLNLAPIP